MNSEVEIINTAVNLIDSVILVQFYSASETPIEMIQISYIVYPTVHDNFIFRTPSSTYQITGISNITGSSFKTENFTVCRQKGGISCKEFERYEAGRCVCVAGYRKNSKGFCVLEKVCPQYEYFDEFRNLCLCETNYNRDINGKCIRVICPQNSVYNPLYSECECKQGFFFNSVECVKTISCPTGSSFDFESLSCKCTNPNQHIVAGKC